MIRLIQGDCLEEMRKLAEEDVKVDLILTDIPYGTTKCKWDNIIPFNEMWDCIHKLSNPSTPICLFGDEPFSSFLRLSNINEWRYDWIWIKDRPSNIFHSKKRPMKYQELISVFYKEQCKFYYDRIKIPRIDKRVSNGQKVNYVLETDANSVVTGDGAISGKYIADFNKYDKDWKNPSQHIYFNRVIGNSKENVNHPTQKPVKLMEHFIKTYTDNGDLVLDFTMGSGSTGVACQELNRKFIGIELNKDYYDIAVKRIKETRKQQKLL